MKCCKIKSQVIHHDLNERKFNTSSRNAFAGCHWQSWKDFSVTQKQAKTCFRDFAQIKGFVLLKISTGWVTELEIAEKQVTALFTSRISLNSKRQTNNLQWFLDNEIVAQVQLRLREKFLHSVPENGLPKKAKNLKFLKKLNVFSWRSSKKERKREINCCEPKKEL